MKKILFYVALCLLVAPLSSAEPLKIGLSQAGDTGLTKEVLLTKKGRSVFYSANDEVAILKGGSEAVPSRGYSLMSTTPEQLKEKLADASSSYGYVYYGSRLKSERSRYIATGRIMVQLDPGVPVSSLASAKHLTVVKPVNAKLGIFLLEPSSRLDLVQQCNELNTMPQVKYASPEWIRPVLLR